MNKRRANENPRALAVLFLNMFQQVRRIMFAPPANKSRLRECLTLPLPNELQVAHYIVVWRRSDREMSNPPRSIAGEFETSDERIIPQAKVPAEHVQLHRKQRAVLAPSAPQHQLFIANNETPDSIELLAEIRAAVVAE